MSDLTQSDDIDRDLFRKYSIALKMWARRFNTAEIAAHLKEPEYIGAGGYGTGGIEQGGDDVRRLYGLDGEKWVAYFWFVGWDCFSLGVHVCVGIPNVEFHLPFGFIRIGRQRKPVRCDGLAVTFEIRERVLAKGGTLLTVEGQGYHDCER